jgi:outer membrane protein OmpA-like peptidoglycan-associated protein
MGNVAFGLGEKTNIDLITATQWAIAQIEAVGALVGGRAIFDLVNVNTARAHRLSVTTAGIGLLKISGSFSASDYFYFRTPRPVNFDDFDHRGARLTGASAVAYSWTWLTIYDGPAYISPVLGSVRISGWGPSLPGADVGHGTTGLLYGDGRPIGVVETVININIAPTPEQLNPRIQITQRDQSLVIKIKGDVLFDFDKHEIKEEAKPILHQAGAIIRSNPRLRHVVIEGHTDGKGTDHHNMNLSKMRAESTAEWLANAKGGYLANATLETKGLGSSRPVAPNKRPDGLDNPEGRAQNRRIEIFLEYRKR